ncbi:hypothetical protein DH2020_020712 [Rehmannia glutinosa]|uniref:RING-type E3 ubiquitin transferase n=1 Tax=Rehmannia glutinosa TaxID=99300 RepID=A0ABR0WGV1_REHGL
MPQPTNERTIYRKSQNQRKKLPSFSESRHHCTTESRNSLSENPNKKKRFLFVKFKGLGCKGTSLPVSTPGIIRSAAEWEAKRTRNQKRVKMTSQNRRNLENVVVDVNDVCCTPPGIGISSDFAPRNRNTAPRPDHRKMLMLQRPILSARFLREHDQYQGWRLNVDDMSYEELLDLGDKIGYVGTGLQEEEISSCLRKLKQFNSDSTSLLVNGQKDWKCSICQEKCRRDDDIGTLDCGHHHHIQCIKQWLLHKNACPVCKSAAMRE